MFVFRPGWEIDLAQMVQSEVIRPLANEITRDAKRYAPVDTAELREDIDSHIEDPYTALIGSDVEHAAAQELGARPHIIRAKAGSVLASPTQVFGREVHHPGHRAQPYLRPALYQERTP